jgi:SAM-dependent methyltransferase
VADRLGGDGRVVGVDLSEPMLTVARRIRPELEWRHGDVAALPFADGEFDAVLCQMALMFFPDATGAFREMARVARPGGVVAVAVPASLDDQPAYGPFVELAVRHAGAAARTLLDTYWRCGDLDVLIGAAENAGLRPLRHETYQGTARFSSADGLPETEIDASPLGALISDDVRRRIVEGTREILLPWTAEDGTLQAPLRGHLLVAGRS